MEYKEDNCRVALENDVLVFSGKIEASNYSKFSDFLVKVDTQTVIDTVVYDLRQLHFLNSSGIKAIAVHLLKSSKKYRIIINPDLIWQKVGIFPLRLIKPTGFVSIET